MRVSKGTISAVTQTHTREVPQVDQDDDGLARPTHTVRVTSEDGGGFSVRRRRCGRGEWASAASAEEEVEGDKGGWRWEWIDTWKMHA